ncbi:EthD domain-containing protein [Streptomyces sp. NPDC093591]|uniref:EthD domain-containing protein n=1 Tax=Streptomyces sp. NPDC093591 TaxID=3366044 RepID=UPI00382D6627
MPSAPALPARPVALMPPPAAAGEGDGRAKVLHFIRGRDGLDLDEFTERRQTAHEKTLADEQPPSPPLRGYVQHRQVPGAKKALRHFDGRETPLYDGVGALYYDSPDDALTHFPAYERALRSTPPGPAASTTPHGRSSCTAGR